MANKLGIDEIAHIVQKEAGTEFRVAADYNIQTGCHVLRVHHYKYAYSMGWAVEDQPSLGTESMLTNILRQALDFLKRFKEIEALDLSELYERTNDEDMIDLIMKRIDYLCLK